MLGFVPCYIIIVVIDNDNAGKNLHKGCLVNDDNDDDGDFVIIYYCHGAVKFVTLKTSQQDTEFVELTMQTNSTISVI